MIDEILIKVLNQGVDLAQEGGGLEPWDVLTPYQALTAIYEIGLEVIGDFEDVKAINGKNAQLRGQGRNDLRGQFRKAWAKACGVAE